MKFSYNELKVFWLCYCYCL